VADVYIRAREREGRLLPDETVALLPFISDANPLAHEWRLRADSCDRLISSLSAERRPLRVLELGCGNGWMANRIAGVEQTLVIGTDVNDVELEQARRVFGRRAGLDFVHHDMLDAELPMEHPDVIVVASAIQYVPDPRRLIELWVRSLAAHGAIHILDSPIYAPAEVAAARERSRRHYAAIGVPEMVGAYHHHSWEAFEPFTFDVLHRPDASMTRLRRRVLRAPRSPFPWIRIPKDGRR
jgi:SAM-dependent methyltransferase